MHRGITRVACPSVMVLSAVTAGIGALVGVMERKTAIHLPMLTLEDVGFT